MRRALSAALLAVGLATALPAVLTGYSALRGAEGHTVATAGKLRHGSAVTTRPTAVAPCPGTVITVHGDDPVGCDLTPPQRLDVTGITIDQCDQMGGEPIALSPGGELVCEDVDY